MDRSPIRIGLRPSYFHSDVVLFSKDTGQQGQTGHDVFCPNHGSPQSDVGDICGLALMDRRKRYLCRNVGRLAYGKDVVCKKSTHNVLRGMPFDEPLAVLQH